MKGCHRNQEIFQSGHLSTWASIKLAIITCLIELYVYMFEARVPHLVSNQRARAGLLAVATVTAAAAVRAVRRTPFQRAITHIHTRKRRLTHRKYMFSMV